MNQDALESTGKWSGEPTRPGCVHVYLSEAHRGSSSVLIGKVTWEGYYVWWLFFPLVSTRLYGVDDSWQHNSRAGIKKVLTRIYSIILKSLPMTRDSGGSGSLGKEEEKSCVGYSTTGPRV